MSGFTNNPRFTARPISESKPMVALSADEYEALKAASKRPGNIVPNHTVPDDGYRRYAKCLTCNTAYKIFTCYAMSEKHCGQFGPATHTHFSCQCNGGAAITMEGSVRIGTKKDRIVYVEKLIAPENQEQQSQE